jgi:Homeodomain-like domain
MPPPTLQVTLDPDAQAELERRYHTTRDAETRTRYQMVLLNTQGHTPPQIALLVRCSPDTVRRVLKRYLGGGSDAVPHRPTPASHPTTRLGGSRNWSGWPTWTPTRSGLTVRCGRVGCWPTIWPGSPAIGRGSSRSGSRCTGPGLCASGPAGCCRARRTPSRGGQKTSEGGGTPGSRRISCASTRMRAGPRSDPGRRPAARGPAPPARAARTCGPVFARRGRGRPAPNPDPGVVARRSRRSAAGPGPWHQRQAVRLWAGGLARRAPGLGRGRRSPCRATGRPAPCNVPQPVAGSPW